MSIPFLGPVIRVAKAVWDFVCDVVADFFEWLRKPGSKLRLLCGLLAIGLTFKAFESYDRAQQIVVVRQACEADKGTLQGAVAARDRTIARTAADLEAERKRRIAAEAAARKELIEVERRAELAERSLKAFQREYARKPQKCTDALQALEAACPTLRSY